MPMQENDVKRFLVLGGIKWKSSHEKYMRIVSHEYQFIFLYYAYVYIMTDNAEGYINRMKATWSAT